MRLYRYVIYVHFLMCIIEVGIRFSVLTLYCILLLSNLDTNKQQLKTVFKEVA